jgi:hypothetical protein
MAIALLLALAAGVRAETAETLSVEWDPSPEAEVIGYRVSVGSAPGVYDSTVDVGNKTTFTLPSVVAGRTYCFAVAAYSAGPNVGTRSADVCTDSNHPPSLTSPGDRSSVVGTAVTLNLVASDPEGLPITFSATGLPAGLTLNTNTGFISGTPTAASIYSVTVTVSDGVLSTSQSFTWTTTSSAPSAAKLLRPSGTLTTLTPTFEWESVPATTVYRLWVDDSSATDPRIQLDLTPTDAGCTTTGAVCRVSPGVALQPGRGSWSIRASNATGAGPWSGAMDFVVPDTKIPTVAITAPTSASTFAAATSTIALGGTATDDIGVVSVTWTNNLGGSGTATGTSSWSVAALPILAGTNIITVTARDSFGNIATDVLTVTKADGQAPTLAIQTPTTASTYATADASVSVAGYAIDEVGVTQVTWVNDRGGSGLASITTASTSPLLAGLATAAPTTSWWMQGIALKAGANVIAVTAHDAAGNKTTKSITVSLTDAQVPTVVITTPVSASTFSTSNPTIALSGTASDNIGVVQVAWSNNQGGSGAAAGTAAWTVAAVALKPGNNVITVAATDAAGNLATDVLTVTLADAVAPELSITVPTNADTYTTTANSIALGGTASDASGVREVRWANDRGGTGLASGTTAWSVTALPLQPGVNVITVAAIDAAGNVSRDRITVSADGRPPTIAISSPTANSVVRGETVNLAGTSSDDRGVTEVIWSNNRGGSGRATGTTSWSIANAPLQPGSNIFTVTAVDGVGNRTAATVSVTRDSVAPVVSILVPTTAPTFSTTKTAVAISGKAIDDAGTTLVTWQNSRGGSGAATGTSEWAVPAVALLAGTNVITISAKDVSGNVGVATLTVTVDARAPVISFTIPTSSAGYSTSEGSVSIGGSASDDSAVTLVTWSNSRGGSGTATGTSAWSVSRIALRLGLNTLTVTARDAAGNVGYATLAVRVADVKAPAIRLVSPSADASFASTSGVINLAGVATDDIGVARVTWANDRGGSGAASGDATWSVANVTLQAGVNVITVTASDLSGNVASAVTRVTYDRGVPRIALTSPTTAASYATSSSNVSLTGVASDDGSIVRVKWSTDKGQSGDAVGTTSWSVPSLTVGLGTTKVTVTAYDDTGNASSVSLGVTYGDTSKPTLKVYVPTTSGAVTTSASSVIVAGTAIDNLGVTRVTWSTDRGASGAAVGTGNWTTPSIPLASGTTVVTVTAHDANGNTAVATIAVTSTAGTNSYSPIADALAAATK